MKHIIMFGAVLLSNIAYSVPEYLKVCKSLGEQNQVYLGAGWYVIPGQETCLQAATGQTEYLSADGSLITTQSQLEARVTQLEKKITLLLTNKVAK